MKVAYERLKLRSSHIEDIQFSNSNCSQHKTNIKISKMAFLLFEYLHHTILFFAHHSLFHIFHLTLFTMKKSNNLYFTMNSI